MGIMEVTKSDARSLRLVYTLKKFGVPLAHSFFPKERQDACAMHEFLTMEDKGIGGKKMIHRMNNNNYLPLTAQKILDLTQRADVFKLIDIPFARKIIGTFHWKLSSIDAEHFKTLIDIRNDIFHVGAVNYNESEYNDIFDRLKKSLIHLKYHSDENDEQQRYADQIEECRKIELNPDSRNKMIALLKENELLAPTHFEIPEDKLLPKDSRFKEKGDFLAEALKEGKGKYGTSFKHYKDVYFIEENEMDDETSSMQFLLSGNGSGVVYLAYSDANSQWVAVKKCVRFSIESKILSQIKAAVTQGHPNIVELFRNFHYGGTIYFVFSLYDFTLREYLEQYKVRFDKKCDLVKQMLEGLRYLHEGSYSDDETDEPGIVHKDLKPANIMIKIKEGKPVVKLIDFGLSKPIKGTVRTDNSGDPLWVPPKKTIRSKVSDLFVSLMLIYFIHTGGEHPFFKDQDDPDNGDVLVVQYSNRGKFRHAKSLDERFAKCFDTMLPKLYDYYDLATKELPKKKDPSQEEDNLSTKEKEKIAAIREEFTISKLITAIDELQNTIINESSRAHTESNQVTQDSTYTNGPQSIEETTTPQAIDTHENGTSKNIDSSNHPTENVEFLSA